MMYRHFSFCVLILGIVLLSGCTPTSTIQPAVATSERAPVVLNVSQIQIVDATSPPVEGDFIDKNASERLGDAIREFLENRVQADGSEQFARLTINKALLIEKPREVTGGIKGIFIKEAASDLEAEVEVRVAIENALGIAQAFADISVGRTRQLAEGLNVVEKEAATETMISDLLRQLDDQLVEAIETELRAYKRI